MAPEAIRAVLFDAVGTLFHSRGSIGEIYASVAADYGIQADPGVLQEAFVRLMESRPTPVEKDDWNSLVRSVFSSLRPFPRFDDFFEDVYALFQTKRGWLCYPETTAVLQTLRQNRLRLGVVSNFDRRLPSVLDDLQIRQFFHAIVTPHTSGYMKPDRRIFHRATSLLEVEPEEALFVGDDPSQDVEAAARAGLRSVLIDRQGRALHAPRRLDDLRGISQVLGIKAS